MRVFLPRFNSLRGPSRKTRDLAFLAASLIGLSAGARAAPAPAGALYYETETAARTLAIDRLVLSAPRASSEVVEVGNVTVFGIAVQPPYLFWSFQVGVTGRGAIMRVSSGGGHVRRLWRRAVPIRTSAESWQPRCRTW